MTKRPTTEVYENGKLVGYTGSAYNRNGKLVQVFIPVGE